jgi:hypothetical protein
MDAQKIEPPGKTSSGRTRLVHWFCAYCGIWFFAPAGADPGRCPTKGCTRPFGFGSMSRVRHPETS